MICGSTDYFRIYQIHRGIGGNIKLNYVLVQLFILGGLAPSRFSLAQLDNLSKKSNYVTPPFQYEAKKKKKKI